MQQLPHQVIDANGRPVLIGQRVRILKLSGEWFDQLPLDERADVESMIGEVFTVEEIDEYGHPWVCKWWPDDGHGSRSHSIALEAGEMELVQEDEPSS